MTTDPATAYARWGHHRARPLGRGMEGTVHHLGPGPLGENLIAKAWHTRTVADLRPLQAFYDELAAQHLPFATPRILHLRHLDQDVHHGPQSEAGTAVTVEPHLAGTALNTLLDQGSLTHTQAQDTFTQVLQALARTRAGRATRALPVLDEQRPLWEGHTTWPSALSALVRRRTDRFAPSLRTALPDLDSLLAALSQRLERLPREPARIVHGDLCAPNILATDQGEPTAVLDWGFFTTAAAPLFDVSTAAGFYDMYGPRAREFDDTLLARWAGESGPERERALLYRAAYGLAGANAYSQEGDDGHFAWCVRLLERADVRAALGVGE
ncbi:phosphotransferase family protein [Nocardiopsis ganjiahuensis]|uniref:phosphotransferase family protein n=1 Tax=Nocardiopsis ganjiahuensis TaxID=239984 RepID=UPI000349DF4D|nr:aminoglycoside phosphotransferase family protein [Nocardiopsis ganjiahuensis]